jgi:hypothetical protein
MVSQAQRDALAAPIIEWLRNNPGAECRMRNGRRGLIAHVKNFYAANFSKNPTDAQVKQVITGLLNKHRPGIIRPEDTRKDRNMSGRWHRKRLYRVHVNTARLRASAPATDPPSPRSRLRPKPTPMGAKRAAALWRYLGHGSTRGNVQISVKTRGLAPDCAPGTVRD